MTVKLSYHEVFIIIAELQKDKEYLFKQDILKHFIDKYNYNVFNAINALIDLGSLGASFEKKDSGLFSETIYIHPTTSGILYDWKRDGTYQNILAKLKELETHE